MHKIVALLYFTLVISTWALNFNCELPIGCEVNDIHYEINFYEKTAIQIQGILCNVRDENFQFNFSMPSPLIDRCQIYNELEKQTIEIRFHKDFIFGKWFNIKNMLNFGRLFKQNFNFNFVNLKGFELDIIDNNFNKSLRNLTADYFYYFKCIKCTIAFYSNDRLIKTCQDITDANRIMSLFQFSCFLEHPEIGNLGIIMSLYDPQFKTAICPLFFNNSLFYNLNIIGFTDTFYKRNVLTFENRIFDDLNSTINVLQIYVENINIDSNLMNPSVFQRTEILKLFGKVKTIDGRSLNLLKSLYCIMLSKDHFRDMIHKNGIKWMRDLNSNLSVNLSNFKDLESNYKYIKEVNIYCNSYNPEIRLSKVFPDEDFCLYKDFPFKQLVILAEYAEREEVLNLLKTRDYTCTYLWLAQYLDKFLQFKR